MLMGRKTPSDIQLIYLARASNVVEIQIYFPLIIFVQIIEGTLINKIK